MDTKDVPHGSGIAGSGLHTPHNVGHSRRICGNQLQYDASLMYALVQEHGSRLAHTVKVLVMAGIAEILVVAGVVKIRVVEALVVAAAVRVVVVVRVRVMVVARVVAVRLVVVGML